MRETERKKSIGKYPLPKVRKCPELRRIKVDIISQKWVNSPRNSGNKII